jgi:hypothetical protein
MVREGILQEGEQMGYISSLKEGSKLETTRNSTQEDSQIKGQIILDVAKRVRACVTDI